jgi:hypothetical protein
MTTAEIIRHAAWLLSLYQGLRAMLLAKGLPAGEFDELVRSEAKRLDGYGTSVDDAVADIFKNRP